MFHIDFGFAMGEDPKPYPPPFKLNKPMINVFEDEYRKKFVSRCVTYYLYLRKHAKVVLNLMLLMVHSNLITNPRKNKTLDVEAIKQMGEKFRLTQSEVDAEEFFKVMINESVDSVFANVWDKIHYWKQKFQIQIII